MKFLSVITAIACGVLTFILYALTPQINDCTIFTISNETTTVFGNNEDWHSSDLIINFSPSTESKYGYVSFGHIIEDTQNYEGAVNDHGLAWDVNSLPSNKTLNSHPEKQYHFYDDRILHKIIVEHSLVEEVIELMEQVDFSGVTLGNIHIADSTGDAVIISPGDDGEIAFTRIDEEFLLSTNFNHAIEGHGKQGWRYDTAYKMLSDYDNEPLQEYGIDVLEAVKLNMLTTFTIYSYSADLTNNTISVVYMSQFGDPIIIDIDEVLDSYQGYIPLSSFFPEEVAERGDEAYQRFETRFRIVQVVAIILAFLILVSIVYNIYRIIRRRRHRVVNAIQE